MRSASTRRTESAATEPMNPPSAEANPDTMGTQKENARTQKPKSARTKPAIRTLRSRRSDHPAAWSGGGARLSLWIITHVATVMSTGAVATPPAKRAPHLRLGSFNASLLVRQFDTCRVQRLGTCIELLLRPMKLGRRLIQSRLTLRLHACLSL